MSLAAMMLEHDPLATGRPQDARLTPAALVSRKHRKRILAARKAAVFDALRKSVEARK